MTNVLKWTKGIRGKLLIIIAVATFFMLLVLGVQQYELKIIRKDLNNITDVRLKAINLLEEIIIHSEKINLELTKLAKNNNENEIVDVRDNLKKEINENDKNISAISQLALTENEIKKWEKNFKSWLTTKADLNKLISAPINTKEDNLLQDNQITNIQNNSEANIREIENFLAENKNNLAVDALEANSAVNELTTYSITISLISITLLIIVAGFIAQKLASTISSLIEKLKSSNENVVSSANQIRTATEDLSNSNTEQASALQETVTAVEEINSMIARNSEHTTSVTQIADRSLENAKVGEAAVHDVEGAMNKIEDFNQKIINEFSKGNERLKELMTIIKNINEKTQIINDIVFQTKLLSFNASVEAARAGEQGRGFSVVAEEVGNLAKVSGEAAKDIAATLNNSISKVDEILKSNEKEIGNLLKANHEEVVAGAKYMEKCLDAFKILNSNVAEVNVLVKEIAEASTEQSDGINEISQAMNQIDVTTQKNTSTSHETYQSAESLNEETQILTEVIEELTITIEGQSSYVNQSKVTSGELSSYQVAVEEFQKSA